MRSRHSASSISICRSRRKRCGRRFMARATMEVMDMYPAEFEYYTASTVSEALSLLNQHKDAKLLAGGHSLLPLMKLRLAQPPALIDIGNIQDMKGIRDAGDMLTIGALTTHAQLERSERVRNHCRVLSETAALIGD